MNIGAQRIEAQQPSESLDMADAESWAAIPLTGNNIPDLPWSGAAQDEAAPRRGLLAPLLAALAMLWLAVTAWATFANGGGPTIASAVQWVALAAGPLALLGVAWLLFVQRTSQQSTQFLRAAGALRTEGAELDRVLAGLAVRLEAKHSQLGDDAVRLMAVGDEASDRLGRVAHYLSKEGAKLEARSEALEQAAQKTQREFSLLLTELPAAEERARKIAETIKQASDGARMHAEALDLQLNSLSARGREAEEAAGGAAQRLVAHLANFGSASAAATTGLESAADNLDARVDALGNRIGTVAAQIAAQEQTSRNLAGELIETLDVLEQRLAAFQGGTAIDSVRTSVRSLDEELSAGNDHAAALLEHARSMSALVGGIGTRLDSELPDAFSRLEQQAERTHSLLAAMAPEMAIVAGSAEAAATRLHEAESSIANRSHELDTLVARLNDSVGSAQEQVRSFVAAAAEADEAAGKLAVNSGPALIETLVRVREAAGQAAERAREAIAAVIPESAAALGEASQRAMSDAVGSAVGRQMVELETLAERTVDTARRASERLTRQMLTIGETTAAVEERIAEVRKDAETKENENFSRRVALLIESLNSTAIDVTKILSNEVTDGAWAAYLKGDRGVFTRRAVKLIDTGEAREIMAHYEAEPEFREQVNRYIHDFEAMLRRVLADRESSALGVTLLGSDMGKLYVALAQAIERLRT